MLITWSRRLYFDEALRVILYDGDLDEPDPNFFPLAAFVNFQGESLTEHQSVIVASGPHEASVMRSIAGTPALIQLESKDVLTGVERVARFWCDWIVLYGG